MTPAANAALVPHTHAPADVEVIVRKVLADLAVVEPISVDAETAAKLVGCCSKTLAGLPAAEVGRLKLNRRTLYDLTTLRAYIRRQIAK